MGDMPPTMGLALLPFVRVWLIRMAAMMLSAVAPVASLYLRTITTRHITRVAAFVSGYLLVWAAARVPAFVLAEGATRLADQPPRRREWPRCPRSSASRPAR
jgi:predicted metal-binding membrane protein